MLIVRFGYTFRERAPEWATSFGMLLWGLMTLASSPSLFHIQSFFHPLLLIMAQPAWGLLAAIAGTVRLVFLIINGAWRPSAHIRALGCVLGSMLWGSLLVASLSLPWLTPTIASYVTLLALDLLSLWFSAGDAKLADLTAKGKLKSI